jgi:hypothetical protein
MTIPASGSVSMTNIRTEWSYGGTSGQPPDSMSEYYAGNLNSNNNPVTVANAVSYSSTNIYFPAVPGSKGVPGTPAYNGYYRQFGRKMSQLGSSTAYPYIGGQSTLTYAFKEGIDQVGNAGQIPSSGAISFNHFRGTDNNPTTTNRYTAGFWASQSKTNNGAWGNLNFALAIGGTWGTNYNAGANWNTSTCPFRYIDVPAKDGVPTTRLYGSDTHQNSGWITGKQWSIQGTYPGIGAYTTFSWTTATNTNVNMSGTWNISITK